MIEQLAVAGTRSSAGVNAIGRRADADREPVRSTSRRPACTSRPRRTAAPGDDAAVGVDDRLRDLQTAPQALHGVGHRDRRVPPASTVAGGSIVGGPHVYDPSASPVARRSVLGDRADRAEQQVLGTVNGQSCGGSDRPRAGDGRVRSVLARVRSRERRRRERRRRSGRRPALMIVNVLRTRTIGFSTRKTICRRRPGQRERRPAGRARPGPTRTSRRGAGHGSGCPRRRSRTSRC